MHELSVDHGVGDFGHAGQTVASPPASASRIQLDDGGLAGPDPMARLVWLGCGVPTAFCINITDVEITLWARLDRVAMEPCFLQDADGSQIFRVYATNQANPLHVAHRCDKT